MLYDCDSVKPKRPRKKIKHFPKHARIQRTRRLGDVREDGICTWNNQLGVNQDCSMSKTIRNQPIGSTLRYMEDTTGFIQNGHNPCFHEIYDGTIDFPTIVAVSEGVTGELSCEDTICLINALREGVPKPSGDLIDDLSAMAEHHMVAATDDGGESVANFFIELIQMAEGNLKVLKRYGSLLTTMLQRFKEAYERYLRQGHSSASANWLAWNFAIKPTLSDLKRLACAVHNARKRFKWLQQRNHIPTKVQFRVQDCLDPGDVLIYDLASVPLVTYHTIEPCVPGFGSNVSVEIDPWIELRKLEYTLDFCAEGWVRWDLPDWVFESPEIGTGYLLLQQEGITNPLKIAWNAIPYTWLADWFVSYRTQLQQRGGDLGVFPDGTLLSSGHSWKLESRWAAFCCWDDDNGHHEHKLGNVQYNTYTRKIGLPQSESTPFRVPWEGYNLSIIASLVSQWWTRRR